MMNRRTFAPAPLGATLAIASGLAGFGCAGPDKSEPKPDGAPVPVAVDVNRHAVLMTMTRFMSFMATRTSLVPRVKASRLLR